MTVPNRKPDFIAYFWVREKSLSVNGTEKAWETYPDRQFLSLLETLVKIVTEDVNIQEDKNGLAVNKVALEKAAFVDWLEKYTKTELPKLLSKIDSRYLNEGINPIRRGESDEFV